MSDTLNFNEVKERVTFQDAITKLGLEMSEAMFDGKDAEGNAVKLQTFRGQCPKCGGGKRGLSVTPARGFMCFASSNDPAKRAKGSDVIALAAHIKGMSQKDAAKYLMNGAPAPQKSEGLQPLDHLHHKHERVQAIIAEETAIHLGVGFASKGIMRGCVAVPLHDQDGTLLAYVGIQEDGTYRFPQRFLHRLHIFNAHAAKDDLVKLCPTVQDALQEIEAGQDAIAMLTSTLCAEQLNTLAHWLKEHNKLLYI